MKGKRDVEKYVIVSLRTLIFSLLIIALTIPQILLPISEEKIIFVVDRSASVHGSEEQILDWIEKSLDKKNSHQSYAVVSFAKGATVETTLSKTKKDIHTLNGASDPGETNIEEGLQFAEALLPNQESGRLVLLTDGNETSGNALDAVKLLKNRSVELDYAVLKRQQSEEVSITSLDVEPSLYEGENAEIRLTIDSNIEKTANVRVSVNNQEVIKKDVVVKEGKNEYSFSHLANEPGMNVYKGEIVVQNDHFIENNAMYAVSNVKGTPRVLVVSHDASGTLTKVLRSSGLLVDTLIPEKLPESLAGFLQYQSIIFDNVPGTSISQLQMELIEKAVKDFGTGFVMLGGDQSFGLGGYFKTPIEKILPVDMDIKGKKQMPSLGLVIVMDRSGSMSGNKIELAKEAAARSVELLREEDTLGFIAFDDRPWVIAEAEPLTNKKKTIKKIRSITPGGGTEIYTSLEKAYEELENLKLQRKHIILLTDGQSAPGDYETLITNGLQNNITLSTVAIGSDSDRTLLEELANQGTGRFYDVTDASVIPSILSRETVMATRTYIEDHPFYPKVSVSSEWNEIVKDGIPKMNAYIATTAKQRANVDFMSEKEDPILASWQYGLGTTFAFTSDSTGKWSGDWAAWEKWPEFLMQLATKSLPKYESEPFQTSVEKRDGNTVVTLKTTKDKFLPIEAAIVTQTGKSIDVNTKLVAPGEYELVFPNEPGMYFLSVNQTAKNGKSNFYKTGFTVPYSEEYLLQGTNRAYLKELTAFSGGKELIKESEAFRPLKNKSYTKQEISEWLLLLAFLIFVIEIVIRRFGLMPIILLLKRSRVNTRAEVSKATSTLKQLSAEKNKRVNKEEKKVLAPLPARTTNRENEKQTKSTVKREVVKGSEKDIDREERMKRLLEAKKRKNGR